MFVTQQYMFGKAAAFGLDHGDLPPPLADQVVTGSFRRESMIKLDAVDVFRIHAIHQNDVFLIDIERKTCADDQNVVA